VNYSFRRRAKKAGVGGESGNDSINVVPIYSIYPLMYDFKSFSF
jgi:hypothetical protein